MRKTAWMLAGALALPLVTDRAALAADADGASTGAAQKPWARWQGRLSLGTPSGPSRLATDFGAAKNLSSASLMGDYYFDRAPTLPGQIGGLRATSGLIFGPRSMLSTGQPGLASGSAFNVGSRAFGQPLLPYGDPASDTATMPYLGVGYTSLAVRSGWSFSADLGLVGQSTGTLGFGRSLGTSQSLDDAIRQMRMTPLLQLGVSYAF